MGNLVAENPKATVTVIVSAVMVIVAYLLNAIWGITLPTEVGIAVSTLLAFFLGRWTRINKGEAEAIKGLQE